MLKRSHLPQFPVKQNGGFRPLAQSLGCIALGLLLPAVAGAGAYIDPDEAAASDPDFLLQGEFVGELESGDSSPTIGVQVVALGEGDFRIVSYKGGLPGDGWNGEEPREWEGERDGESVTVGDPPLSATIEHEVITVRHDERGEIGSLERVTRESPTQGMSPPEGAIVLFDGTSVDHWRNGRMTDDGLLIEGAITEENYGDATIHVEFLVPFRPTSQGQARANSGVYIQNRYEVQILDTFGLPATDNGNASFYQFKAPDVHVTYPPLTWQTYDIEFTAARFDENGEKFADARATVHHNGVLVHDDIALPPGTGAGASRGEVARGPLLLQDHSAPVRFRNVWLLERR